MLYGSNRSSVDLPSKEVAIHFMEESRNESEIFFLATRSSLDNG